MKITQFFLQRKASATAIILALLILGIYGFTYLPVDFLPEVTYPMIKIHIWWRGATPEEIDKNIADPIERQVSQVDDLDFLDSSSIEGMYTCLVNFKYGTDINIAYQDVLAAMARVAKELPRDMEAPVVVKADPSQLPVVQMTISSEKLNLTQLRSWVEEWLQTQMIAVEGVAGAEIIGGLKREIRIHLDPLALEKFNLSVEKLAAIIEQENVDQFGGRLRVGRREIIARTRGEFNSLEQIENLVVLQQDGRRVYLRDIARIEDSHEEVRVITRLNQVPCVKLNILKQASANTIAVSKAVLRRIDELNPVIPEQIKLGIVENQSDYIENAINGVKNTAFQASVLVILIVWLFLGSFRKVLVIVFALPLTLIVNFGLMKLMGFSLNIFSLGGLVIAIGILVDNSIIVIETVGQKMKSRPDGNTSELASEAAEEVGPAIVAGTVSFLALFLPFMMVPGMLSLLFNELILVITAIVIVSLLFAVSVTPLLTSILFKQATVKDSAFIRAFARVSESYQNLVASSCRFPWRMSLAFSALLVGAIILMPKLGSEFLPRLDDGRIVVKVKLPTGASLQQTDAILAQLEEKLREFPEIETMFTMSGGRVWGLYTFEIAAEGQIDLQLVPNARRKISTMQFINKIRPLVSSVSVPGGRAMVMPMQIKGIRKLGESDIEVKLRGDSLSQLFSLAQKSSQLLNNLPQLTNIMISLDMSKPEYHIIVDRKKAADMGIPVAAVSRAVRALVTGTVASQYRQGDEYYNIRLLIPESQMLSRTDLENLPLLNNHGKTLRIADVASIFAENGPVEIVREDQTKQVLVRCDANNVSIGEALRVLKQELEKLDLPAGIQLGYGGQAQMIAEMVDSVMRILMLASVLAFLVLVFQFNQFKVPFLIMISIPFCVAGVVYAMTIGKVAVGATVLIGLIVLFAAVINDGVLLFTFADEIMAREKMNAAEAVAKAAALRFRPRLMTTLSTLMGFLPLALGFEPGAGMLQPMAVAATGGLLMEIPVAMLLMPCMYVLVHSKNGESAR